jgi:hypothetical protein
MPWRISEVLAEAIHDLLALGPKVVTAASIACVGAAMVTTTPIFEVRETLESTDELVRQGWATTEISAERSGAVDSASCAALKRIEGVADVYGVRRIGPQRIVQFGGRTVMVHEIFLSDATMAQEVAVGGVPSRAKVAWVGDDIVQQFSGVPVVSLAAGYDLRVVGSFPKEFGIPALAGSLIIPQPWNIVASRIDQCYVRAQPSYRDEALTRVATAALRIESVTPIVRGVAPGLAEHPYRSYLQRSSRWIPAAVGLLIGLMWALTVRSRSSEVGVLLLSGMRRTEVGFFFTIQVVLLAAMWFALVVVGGAASSQVFRTPFILAGWPYLLYGLLTMISVGCIASIVVARVDVSLMLKDR